MDSQPHQNYRATQIRGNARVHLGDTYTWTVHSPRDGSLPPLDSFLPSQSTDEGAVIYVSYALIQPVKAFVQRPVLHEG